jgi:hypothetical protein
LTDLFRKIQESTPRDHRLFGSRGGLALAVTLLSTLFSTVGLASQPPADVRTDVSHITKVNISGRASMGRFDGVPYMRIHGTVEGVVTPHDDVVGFHTLPLDNDGNYVYTSEFELLTPRRQRRGTRTVFVEAENRGHPELFGWINEFSEIGTPSTIVYPPGFGNGFLFEHGHSYARVQWQTGISAGVPSTAQGVGLVIQRDFARLLRAKRRDRPQGTRLPRLRTLILMGDSQSGWEVTTFVGEGFNRDPVTGSGVFDGAIALNGHGNWLAINRLGDDGRPETPYVRPNGVPLTPRQLLSRPESDPLFVNVGAFTDYFRLRASLFQEALPQPGIHHYDWPYPHASLFILPSPEFPFVAKGCNAGNILPLNPVDMRPYLRKIVSGLAMELGKGRRRHDFDEGLPASTLFNLGPAPPSPPAVCSESTASENGCTFNPLQGEVLATPRLDDDRQPLGGVRFPDVVLPLGRPDPAPLSHVGTLDISDLCGNFWAWQPFERGELLARYGSTEEYAEAYEEVIKDLVEAQYLLEDEADVMLMKAVTHFESLVGGGYSVRVDKEIKGVE